MPLFSLEHISILYFIEHIACQLNVIKIYVVNSVFYRNDDLIAIVLKPLKIEKFRTQCRNSSNFFWLRNAFQLDKT